MDTPVQTIVGNALRLCGQMQAPLRSPSPEQITEVLFYLNQLLDSWNTMRNQLYTVSIVTQVLTPNVVQFSIGPGGFINTARPQRIQRANCIYQTSPTLAKLPIELIDDDQYSAIRIPEIFAIPLKLYYDGGYSQASPTGLAQIYLWPGPQSDYTLELYVWNALGANLSYDDTFFAPPGYSRALSYNLALEIMPLYRQFLSPEVEQRVTTTANEAKQWVESLNAPAPLATIDPAIMGTRGRRGFNWLVSTD